MPEQGSQSISRCTTPSERSRPRPSLRVAAVRQIQTPTMATRATTMAIPFRRTPRQIAVGPAAVQDMAETVRSLLLLLALLAGCCSGDHPTKPLGLDVFCKIRDPP